MEPALIRVEEAAKFISLGRSKTYELIAAGEIPVVRIGRSVRVPVEGLRTWVRRQEEEANGVR
ncbi:hypothetical protein BH23CHL4_BH23CHL4_30680 [soil metagenome]